MTDTASNIHATWQTKSLSAEERDLARGLSSELGLHPIVSGLLVQRGITSPEAAQAFMTPKLDQLHNPYLLEDMEVAVRRISHAIDHGEQILIYGDYDVDGTTAVSLVYCVLRDHLCSASKLSYYIPDRNDEGYGISHKALDDAHSRGVSLMIALDCGIKAHDELAYAHTLGIDCIVCDHHRPDETLPPALAILNPKREGNQYPNTHLSGCGVGFKLMQALVTTWGLDESILYSYLDLVAISIAADIVPVVGENRTLLYYGLKQLNTAPSLGIKELIRLTKLSKERIDMGSIVYKIAPRINASGRMMNGAEAVALLIADNPQEAHIRGLNLERYNAQRRELDMQVTDEADEMVHSMGDLANVPVLVLYAPHWHKGVLGIVASRLTERYNRPTLILTRNTDGTVSGSARAMHDINLYRAIEACQHHLINFGGHTHAVGITITEEQIAHFRQTLTDYFHHHIERDEQTRQINIDAELKIEEITPQLYQQLARLAPFGLMNEVPIFATYRLRDAGGSKVVGRDDRHLKLRLTDRYCKVRPIHGIALRQATHARWIQSQQSFAACYSIEENSYYGPGSIQLQVKDIITNR